MAYDNRNKSQYHLKVLYLYNDLRFVMFQGYEVESQGHKYWSVIIFYIL